MKGQGISYFIESKVTQNLETDIKDILKSHEPALHEEIQQVNSREFTLCETFKRKTAQGEL